MKTQITKPQDLHTIIGKTVSISYSDYDNGSINDKFKLERIEKKGDNYILYNPENIIMLNCEYVGDGKSYGIQNGFYAGDDFDLVEFEVFEND